MPPDPFIGILEVSPGYDLATECIAFEREMWRVYAEQGNDPRGKVMERSRWHLRKGKHIRRLTITEPKMETEVEQCHANASKR